VCSSDLLEGNFPVGIYVFSLLHSLAIGPEGHDRGSFGCEVGRRLVVHRSSIIINKIFINVQRLQQSLSDSAAAERWFKASVKQTGPYSMPAQIRLNI
jgi:hypothetical protein